MKTVVQLRVLQNEENLLNKRASTKFIRSYLVYGVDYGIVLHSKTFYVSVYFFHTKKKTYDFSLCF